MLAREPCQRHLAGKRDSRRESSYFSENVVVSGLAQSVERSTAEQEVAGSIPGDQYSGS